MVSVTQHTGVNYGLFTGQETVQLEGAIIDTVVFPRLNLLVVGAAFGGILALGFVAGLLPALRVARQDPAAALRMGA